MLRSMCHQVVQTTQIGVLIFKELHAHAAHAPATMFNHQNRKEKKKKIKG